MTALQELSRLARYESLVDYPTGLIVRATWMLPPRSSPGS